MMSMSDKRMLKRMGITALDAASDPHHECLVRWLEEREKRCTAEASLVQNAQAYQTIMERADVLAEHWRLKAWCFGVLAAVIFVLSAILLVLRR